jgi:signal transduction histidine kinase
MKALLHRVPFGRGLLPLLLVLVELGAAESAWAAEGQKQVLVLYSTRRDAQIAVVGERDLPRILDAGLGASLDYYSEYIDRARFPDPSYKAAFRDFLRLKYRDHRFDVVIALQDVALEFVGDNRNELFPDTPVVYFSGSPGARRIPDSTGVISNLNFSDTLAMALQLQPDIQRVFVVSGAEESDKEYESLVRVQFQPFEPRVGITYLAGLATNDLEARLAALPAQSIIYYVLASRDGADNIVHPLEYLDGLAAVANAPIYCWVDSAMDHGIVGGSLKSQSHEIEVIGQLALRVLRGERPDGIPTVAENLNVNQVDWRQLQRWGISEARVPAGTLIRFREPSAWDRYRLYILGAAVVLLAQTVLIVGLLVQRTRRRQAELEVREGQSALMASYERIRDLGRRLLNAQETERSRIARELHDDISQQMALLTIDLELLESAPGHSEPLAVEATNRAHDIAKSLHDLSRRLHPARLRLIGLVAAINGLRQELSKSSGIPIDFTHDQLPSTLPPDLTLCLFRVVQEALQNAVKHSRAHQISVHLGVGTDALSLTIADDGVGFDVDAATDRGLGLISMSERLDMHGGTIDIRSRPGAGTRLDVAVPLRAHADSA